MASIARSRSRSSAARLPAWPRGVGDPDRLDESIGVESVVARGRRSGTAAAGRRSRSSARRRSCRGRSMPPASPNAFRTGTAARRRRATRGSPTARRRRSTGARQLDLVVAAREPTKRSPTSGAYQWLSGSKTSSWRLIWRRAPGSPATASARASATTGTSMFARRLFACRPTTKPGCGRRRAPSRTRGTTWGWGRTWRRHAPPSLDLLGRPARQRDHCGGMGEQRAELCPVQVVVVVMRVLQVVDGHDQRHARRC